jgi:hypothetical protein
MDAYKVLSTVRNGQLLIDMPINFDNTDVEVIVLQVVRSATNDVQTPLSKFVNSIKDKERIEEIENPVLTMSDLKSASKAVSTNLRPELEEVEAIIPARKKIDLTQLFGAFNNKSTDLNELEDDDSDFWQPRKRTDITKLRGALKLNMTIDEIDLLTKSWRDEWERDFS